MTLLVRGLLLLLGAMLASAALAADPPAAADVTSPGPTLERSKALLAAGHYRDALQALEAHQSGTASADFTLTLGRAYLAQGKYDPAEKAFSTITRAGKRRTVLERRTLFEAQTGLGHAFALRGAHDKARKSFQQSLALRKQVAGPASAEAAQGMHDLGNLHRQLAQWTDARRLMRQALQIRERKLGAQSAAVAESLHGLGVLDFRQGRYADGERQLLAAVTLRSQVLGADHPETSRSQNFLAVLYADMGRFAEAMRLLETTLKARESRLGVDHPDVADNLGSLAGIRHDLGQFRTAEALYRRAIEQLERQVGVEHEDVSVQINNLALLYEEEGREEDAIGLYNRSLQVSEKVFGPRHPSVAASLGNLCVLKRQLRRFEDAEKDCRRALSLRESDADASQPDVADSLNSLGNLLAATGKLAEARALLERAVKLRQSGQGSGPADLAESLNDLALVQLESGDLPAAQAGLQRALEIREKLYGPAHPTTARTLFNLGRLHRQSGDVAKARAVLARAYQIILERFGGEPEHFGSVSELKRRKAGLVSYVAALAATPIPNPAPQSAANVASAFEAAQLARATGTSAAVARMAARFATQDNALGQAVKTLNDLRMRGDLLEKRLVQAAAQPPRERNATLEQWLREELAGVRAEQQKLDQQIAATFGAYRQLVSHRPAPLPAIQALLKDDEALLAWVFAGSDAMLLAVRRDQAALYRLPIDEAQLATKVRQLRVILNPEDPRPFPGAAAHELFVQLVGPVRGMLEGVRHLIVVPDGPLESLPVAVLLTEPPPAGLPPAAADAATLRQLPWLMNRFAISNLPSISSLVAFRQFAQMSSAPGAFFGIGDPLLEDHPQGMRLVAPAGDGGQRAANQSAAVSRSRAIPELLFRAGAVDLRSVQALPSLPETADELRRIAQALGAADGSLMLRERATESGVKSHPLNGARVIAFATHGAVAGELRGLAEPALVLTPPAAASAEDDGLLTASEVALLKLDADLVLLSACNTAAGDGTPGAEGLSGLAKAFVHAGARSLLVSHWPVASEPTVRLTTRMIEAAPAGSADRAAALQSSMRAMLQDTTAADFAHPAFWAPFSLIGVSSQVSRSP